METYTIEELLQLRDLILFDPSIKVGGAVDSPEAALLNTKAMISNYKEKKPEFIHDKILEFADVGKLAQSYGESEGPHSYTLIYNLIYTYSLEDLILYTNTEYYPILTWRFSLAKDQ